MPGKLCSFILIVIVLARGVCATERLEIDFGSDTAYLPYYLEPTSRNASWGKDHYQQAHPIDVIRQIEARSKTGNLLVVCSPQVLRDEPTLFEMRGYPSWNCESDPVNLIINDWGWYRDQQTGLEAIATAGYRGDSFFVARLFPDQEGVAGSSNLKEQSQRYLCRGGDSNGDGKWRATTALVLLEDYDLDSLTEAVFYINGGGDYYPRRMFCVEMETFRIQWELDVACTVSPRDVHACYNDSGPCIIFVGYNPKNDVTDSHFCDLWGHLAVVDTAGQVIANSIKAYNHGANWLIRGADSGTFYTIYEVPLVPSEQYQGDSSESLGIAKINSLAEPIEMTECGVRPYELWLGHWPGYDEPVIYARLAEGAIAVYDGNLNLIAESAPGPWADYIGEIEISGEDRPLLVFRGGLYKQSDNRLKRLLAFDTRINECQALSVDSLGRATTIAISGSNWYQIGHVRKRGWLMLVNIFYRNNQSYVLMLLSGLLVGLVSVNYYRRRTQRNRDLIARQKEELERTHEALKKAQQQIIEQEKQKQAKDIAGGFAHEVRNALLPVETALVLLRRLEPGADDNHDKVLKYSSNIKTSVTRALDLTKLISDYTALEAQVHAEPVSLQTAVSGLFDEYGAMIRQTGVSITLEVDPAHMVTSNNSHLRIVLTNLLLNSLDALTQTDNPTIIVSSVIDAGTVILKFEDNGCGIAPEELPRIFDLFFSTKPSSGRGWGLTISRRIMELYEGTIAVASGEMTGAVFTLTFAQPPRST